MEDTSAAEAKPTKWKHAGPMDNLKWERARHEHEQPQATADVPAELQDEQDDLQTVDGTQSTINSIAFGSSKEAFFYGTLDGDFQRLP